ncbi:hypothetical protein GA0116948_1017 [Chitinophaga costaii]|uniref:SWIM-type domain-containing protein n=1 Tax=Chitinophaga costaii TaxID=1335309 RepID=A0A1C3YP00_9BACT|nr:hypothetical protein [Chitinophaga costaii]PUZ30022.1 hypothetical protein DCM91_00640 [Chitinophaga costaii]SCB71758.1 hypothetical protein GA0116948_1017 [Chitinophaga costaii]
MELSLNNVKTVLPKAIITKAGKCTVRECDELEKGHFQAYVDEQAESFDVSITLGDKNIVTAHSCDCKRKQPVCHHKVALLLHLKKGSSLPSSSQKKKTLQLESLVDQVGVDELRAWIKTLLGKNKDLELAFVHQFTQQQKEHTPADIKQLTQAAVKAVLKNRKKADTSEVKKIVELWIDIHASFVAQYRAHLTDETLFLLFNAIIAAVEDTQGEIITTSNRFDKYLEKQFADLITALDALQDDEAWHTATSYFTNHTIYQQYGLRKSYLFFHEKLLLQASAARKQWHVKALLKQYTNMNLHKYYNGEAYTEMLLNMTMNTGLFNTCYSRFKPIYYNNKYNLQLITGLIDLGQLPLAEQYCEQQIKVNVKEEYSIPYLELLRDIYRQEKNDPKLATVLMTLFPLTYNFEDYLFINAQLPDEEQRKNWRSKILARARKATYNQHAVAFAFRLMEEEQKHKKMIDYLDSYCSYQLIAQYAEKMILADKQAFLRQLLIRSDLMDVDYEDEFENIQACVAILHKHYTTSILKAAINATTSRHVYFNNLLVKYILELSGK